MLEAPYPVWHEYIISLPLPRRVTYLVSVFHWQVENGGLHQYFFNAYGQFAYETVAALQLIQAYPEATILFEALQRLRLEEPDKELFRAKIAGREGLRCIVDFEEETTAYLDLLTHAYWELDDTLEQLLERFLTSSNESHKV